MRSSKSIINLANLRTMLGYSFEEIGFIANVKSFPAQEKGGVQESLWEKVNFGQNSSIG